MATPTRKCKHCGHRFEVNQRGRPQLYCKPSHRVRAREKRREAESKLPSEKEVRLLTECLTRLVRQRRRYSLILMAARNWKLALPPPYERARAKVRDALEKLAPEVFEQPSAPAEIELREFTKTYRQLAAEHHPDHGGASQVMQALNQLRQALQTDIELGHPRAPGGGRRT